MTDPWSHAVAAEAGVAPEQGRVVFLAAIRQLHRFAVTDPQGLTNAIMECYFAYGAEACCHFALLLDLQRRVGDPELPWSETLARLGPEILPHGNVIGNWRRDAGLSDDDLPPLFHE